MRCLSWNVNGIRAVERKGQLPWEVVPGVDVVGIQETKARPEQLSEAMQAPSGWHAAWHSAEKAGYSGVALFSRDEPDEVVLGCGDDQFDSEGRVISALFGQVLVVSAYFPNSQDGGKRLDYKLAFCAQMEAFLQEWRDAGCETVLLGDYNIAHRPIDLARPKPNEGSAGYLPEERAWMDRYIDELGYHDVFREENPDLADAYSWWSFRGGARSRNVGWRIDYATVSPGLRERASEAQVHADVEGSDHCPVSLQIDL
ncbi:MAG: exodeoxyribonuclease III [Planctomycetota bacterium]|jgi:exodeoxyribonuclease-3|nr:exodeoxyribonuclease III [Planctomycetota bacterium]